METKIVNFHGDDIAVVRHDDGRVFVPMRRVCEHIGLTWSGQYTKLQEDFWREGVQFIGTNNQRQGPQDELCLNIEFLPMFLSQIQISRVKPEIQSKLLRYKTEARKVLADAFLRGGSPKQEDEYNDHPMMVMTRGFLRHEAYIKELKIESRQLELTVTALQEKARIAIELANAADRTVDNLITHRKGKDTVPDGTLTLPMIRSRYFCGVAEVHISAYLNAVNHPKVPYTYELREGVETQSFCYQEANLQDRYERLVMDALFLKSTPKRYMFKHPLLKEPFALAKAELPPGVRIFIESQKMKNAESLDA